MDGYCGSLFRSLPGASFTYQILDHSEDCEAAQAQKAEAARAGDANPEDANAVDAKAEADVHANKEQTTSWMTAFGLKQTKHQDSLSNV